MGNHNAEHAILEDGTIVHPRNLDEEAAITKEYAPRWRECDCPPRDFHDYNRDAPASQGSGVGDD